MNLLLLVCKMAVTVTVGLGDLRALSSLLACLIEIREVHLLDECRNIIVRRLGRNLKDKVISNVYPTEEGGRL